MKIPDVTPARRGRVNLHGSIPDRRNEEGKKGVGASERGDDCAGFMEKRGGASARERDRVKYLTDAATKRPEQTTNKQTKTGIRRLHGACPREERSRARVRIRAVTIFEFSGLPVPRLRGMRPRRSAKSKKNAWMSITRCVS